MSILLKEIDELETQLKKLKRQLNKKPVETCCIVNQHCLSPANLEEPIPVKTTCFSCGQAVCVNCSDIRSYWQYGKVRLCDSCQIEYDGDDTKVKSKIMKMAGY